ncbi:LLM class F420-dependent oxidoreductase [Streptacidiphilus fuscans]|uniref:LLM class F420-dependent oxidoreductase n=1 Tax=Streptacidiphilus fuscans TaxID=2789292 RepID=A0A931AYI6_9ACTN|nr:LLM class F420-dependent oxidoreductase [Streptacidiphilus fuscans]MBF9067784.1 LLM class F420-dependent oxidoreductase [Streptacidiphilus fuscans]MBF9073867.1 LLM class F420-dependent oxidoreductase [Streptacidiphilus fuscans]
MTETPPSPSRWGLTFPLDGIPLGAQRALVESLPDLGFTDLWSMETAGADAFTPLALASVWAPTLNLGTAIVPVHTRGPALLAMQAAALAEAAPGRFSLGLGSSSPVIVQDWNAVPFEQPFQRSRDVLRFLRAAFTGQPVTEEYDTFAVRRFRLDRVPAHVPPVLLAALRSGMLRLAGREADGVILNWLSPDDVRTARAEFDAAAGPDHGKDVVARIFVCPTEDADYARALGRRLIAAYLTVPAYAEFHRWLGRGDALKPLWENWAAGDRKAAAASVPDAVVDDLIVHGPAGRVRERLHEYVANGVTVPVPALLPVPEQGAQALASAIKAVSPA